MALSCYANWVDIDQMNSDMSVFAPPLNELFQPPPPPPELLALDYNCVYSDSEMYPLIDSEDFFYSDNNNYNSLLPYFSSSSSSLDQSTPYTELINPAAEYKLCYEPKRQKMDSNINQDGFTLPGLCHGFVPNPCLLPELLPEANLAPFPDFIMTPLAYDNTITYPEETVKKQNGCGGGGGGGSLSSQSIAARQRRKKITEKTQELGKHIPGGQKMNTAEMLQAAYKYIKFLQAQVAVLEYLPPAQENEEISSGDKELHALLSSSLIQERLYSAEKCLVPTKFVKFLTEDGSIQVNTRVLEEVKKLMLE